MSATISIVDWSNLQHYKKRNPPWIRLYRDLLADPEFMRLQVASRWLAIGLMLLAVECDNEIDADPDWIKWRLRLEEEPDFEALVSAGIITMSQNASDVLATRKQSATPETETETETETENVNTVGRSEQSASKALAVREREQVDQVVEIVSEHREAEGLTSLRGGDKTGRSYIRARIREYDFDLVEAVARYAPSDSWISETTERLALSPIFSPKSFPRLLDRMENHHRSLGGGDRKLMDYRRRIEEVDL